HDTELVEELSGTMPRFGRHLVVLAASAAAVTAQLVVSPPIALAAAVWNNPPQRLYMSPSGSVSPLPVGELPFIGADPISGDSRVLNLSA
ncbi:hypothetical protein, partial [Mesorhizobium sp. WSM4884]|uniref:hypothetical protein n=1 Tax=Mesorhizobium sp. WSM4884 TaxID=3038542 RepID=UPI002416531B